jgi:hypothetical protein
MARKIKVLGLTVMAIFALGAISAQAALAAPEFTGFNTNTKLDEASTVTGTQVGEQEYLFSAGGTPVKCTTAGLTGSAAAKSTTLTVTPSWAGCTSNNGNNPVDIRVNGCEYKFALAVKVVEDLYEGTFSVVCPAGKKIEFEVTTEMGAMRKCLDTIEPQMGISRVDFRDETKAAPTDLKIEMLTTNLVNTTDDEKAKCGVNQELHKDGSLLGTTTVTAKNGKGEGIDFSVVG